MIAACGLLPCVRSPEGSEQGFWLLRLTSDWVARDFTSHSLVVPILCHRQPLVPCMSQNISAFYRTRLLLLLPLCMQLMPNAEYRVMHAGGGVHAAH